jgi:hypothetical protein
MPYLTILFIAGFAVLYHRAAEAEDESGFLWASLSVLISAGTLFWLGWGWVGAFLGQGALFFGIGVYRAMRKP